MLIFASPCLAADQLPPQPAFPFPFPYPFLLLTPIFSLPDRLPSTLADRSPILGRRRPASSPLPFSSHSLPFPLPRSPSFLPSWPPPSVAVAASAAGQPPGPPHPLMPKP